MPDSLKRKIVESRANVAVVGLGYVGLPLAVEFALAGFPVTGLDVNKEKVERVNRADSYIPDVPSKTLKGCIKSGRLTATSDFSVLEAIDTVHICVPTPLGKTKDPDLSMVLAATQEIARYIHPVQLIVLESTTYPGTTEELVLPMLSQDRFAVGRDFYLAFSPERVDPGNKKFTTRNTPKIIGGMTEACLDHAALLYGRIIDSVYPVSSTRAAEMVKLLENTFRSVNIALVNEIALMCDRLGIDVWEVIDAAATKPFGFMPFYPGPGLGGHCIPIDPFYLSWKLKTLNYRARFIELAGEVNSEMPYAIVAKANDALNKVRKSLNGARVLILGVAYKKDTDDVRESPALDILKILESKGARVSYHDSHVPVLRLDGRILKSAPLERSLQKADCVIIVTDHCDLDYAAVVSEARVVIDTRNATKGFRSEKIIKL